jgi:hypothetical protein
MHPRGYAELVQLGRLTTAMCANGRDRLSTPSAPVVANGSNGGPGSRADDEKPLVEVKKKED